MYFFYFCCFHCRNRKKQKTQIIALEFIEQISENSDISNMSDVESAIVQSAGLVENIKYGSIILQMLIRLEMFFFKSKKIFK